MDIGSIISGIPGLSSLIPPGAVVPPLAIDLSNLTPLIALVPSIIGAATVRTLPNCAVQPLKANGICDTSLSVGDRAAALVNEFTLEEKLTQLTSALEPVERLGLPRFTLWNEALHGIAVGLGTVFAPNGSDYSSATQFPQPILTAAAFDDDLVHQVASAVSNEARAFGNAGHAGLDFWAPNVNPFRDPRWGRGKETPGEDPFHVSSYARAYVAGLEGPKGAAVKKTIATCKHSAAYDLENWHNISRYEFNAVVGTQDLAEYYLPPFEACVRDAKVGSVMCSYNALNGVPTCADDWLLEKLIRQHWNWNQTEHYVTSDCFALDQILLSHKYTSTAAAAAQVALKAGTDNDCGIFYRLYMPEALSKGLVSESDLDRALRRVYASLVRLGYFNPPESQQYTKLSWKDVNTPAAQKLARKAASSGMVLLKNSKNALPLSLPKAGKTLKIALFGDWANATTQMLGGYSGTPPYMHSPLFALQQIPGVDVNYVKSLSNTNQALQAAKQSDIALFIGGIDESVEGEGNDRETIAWNSTQIKLIRAISSAGKPTFIVQTGAGQLDDTEFLASKNISAILWAGYPGQDGGPAIMDVLFGKVAPAGRLPVTQYPADYIKVPMTDMALRPDGKLNPGRTYKWYNDTPVVPFGYGLHYTQFKANLTVDFPTSSCISDILKKCKADSSKPIDRCVIGTVTASVRNTGSVISDYAALAFLKGDGGPLPRPKKQLVSYKRVHSLEPGKTKSIKLPITVGSLARWNEKGQRILYPGSYTLALDTAPKLASTHFKITGEKEVLETLPSKA